MAGGAVERVRGHALAAELGHVRHADHHGAGGPEPRDRDIVPGRPEIGEEPRALGDAPARHPDSILDEDRDAREPRTLAASEAAFHRFGLAQAVGRVDRHDGMEGGIARRNPLQGLGHDVGGAGFAPADPDRDRQGRSRSGAHAKRSSRRSS
jgi:hypothetical protein